MFEVVDHGEIRGAHVVRGTGRYAGQIAIFVGPEALDRAAAYAQWLNAAAVCQRRWNDPGSRRGTDPER